MCGIDGREDWFGSLLALFFFIFKKVRCNYCVLIFSFSFLLVFTFYLLCMCM